MKKIGIRKNNRGDSLILVIGCTALLSLLGIVILTKTLDNRMMKQEEDRAQESFFLTDKTSSEMVTVLEAAAQNAVERAFYDMMIEYSLSKDGVIPGVTASEMRKTRFGEFFGKALEREIKSEGLETMLETALGTPVTDMTVSYTDVTVTSPPAPDPLNPPPLEDTDIVTIKNATFSYVANGSKTTITTDISIQAKIPNIEAGFKTSVDCDFSDFALITDGDAVSTVSAGKMAVNGNLYVGQDLHAGFETATAGKVEVNEATKVLVKKNIVVEENAEVKVSNPTVVNTEGKGIWANGILVNGGTVETSNANLYISDDMTLEGINPKVVLSGTGNEYVGYSGGGLTSGPQDYSSAVTINSVDSLTLDMNGLGKLFINGNSYIRDDGWSSDLGGGVTQSVDGVLQGESVAYKDMQAMYLVPGECLSHGYNPIIGDDIGSVNMTGFTFNAGGGVVLDLANYVDPSNPFVTRVDRLDGGTTVVTYVYLNFKNPEAAAAYVKDYMAAPKSDAVKAQIKNLGTGSSIKLATEVRTIAPSITYDGTNLTMNPAVSLSQRTALIETSMLAKQRYKGLFSSLREGGGVSVALDNNLLEKSILKMDTVNDISATEPVEISVQDPDHTSIYYKFVGYNGNLELDTHSPYLGINGILLVNGDLKASSSGNAINGLVLATGDVNVTAGTTFTANSRAVEVLLSHPDVARYFRGYAQDSSDGYLSSEAIDIKFENWKRN